MYLFICTLEYYIRFVHGHSGILKCDGGFTHVFESVVRNFDIAKEKILKNQKK